jgi:hypothetical protein
MEVFMKKYFLAIILVIMAILPQVYAQTAQQQRELEQIAQRSMNGISPQDRQRTVQIMTDVFVAQGMSRQQAAALAEMSADSMFSTDVGEMSAEERRMFEEQERRIADYEQGQRQVETARQQPQHATPTSNPSQLITFAGKAWIIKDNQTQGNGKAFVFKSDNTYEYYVRVYGIWIPRSLGIWSSNYHTYFANGNRLEINYPNDVGGFYTHSQSYTISGNGSTLTITGDERAINGTYTLSGFTGTAGPGGGSVVPPNGMGWFSDGRQMIFNTSGIYAAYGYPSPWVGANHEGTYSLNQSAGTITINENVPAQPGRDTVYNYSITVFSGGNQTLRIWGNNRNGYEDQIYKLQAYPSGTQQPRTR